MKRRGFTKENIINRILDTYNVTPTLANEIFSKTYEKIRYQARKEKLKGFHSTRETFYAIFGKESTQIVSTMINPAMPKGFQYSVSKTIAGEYDSLTKNVGDRLSALRSKYASIEDAYQKFVKDHNMSKLSKAIDDFKRSPEYLKEGSR